MTKKESKRIKRALKASRHNYKENRDMFIGIIRQAD